MQKFANKLSFSDIRYDFGNLVKGILRYMLSFENNCYHLARLPLFKHFYFSNNEKCCPLVRGPPPLSSENPVEYTFIFIRITRLAYSL